MTWVDKVAKWLRRITLIREQLNATALPIDEIERPVGMKRYEFRRRVALLQRLELQVENEMNRRIGRWHEIKQNRSNTGIK